MTKQNNALGAVCSQLLSKEDLNPERAVIDALASQSILTQITLQEGRAVVRLYADHQLLLSDITPILHDFAFVVIDEVTYTLSDQGRTIHICRFNLHLEDNEAFERARENIETVITASLLGSGFGSCRIYALVYKQNLTLRQVTLLRAIIEYMNQAVLSINFETILAALIRHHTVARLFLHYFALRFDPNVTDREAKVAEIEEVIADAIKEVPDIMEDRILKLLFAILEGIVRTNYYLQRESIALKLDVTRYSEYVRGIQPRIESFVFHRHFRGVHLRMSPVSRGGLRWSERYDDYREEIRSLMITQEGKNAIIIPDGAKGGFVIDRPKHTIDKAFFSKVYSQFIDNLLDLVDSYANDAPTRDGRIVAYDDTDAYFVVAADKGTAAMSDTANGIALSRGFWLGDAFASGGSNGYDHKAMGITAKGAMKSSQRFFIERGIDPYRDPISIVGIGSMNGDVFGNGMLLTHTFRLLGAISHREIFIDPDPDPERAYAERKRLFNATDGSWWSYDRECISQGGGVWRRSDKVIILSDAIREMLPTSRQQMSGEELARALLCMKVDLLFNGGVGTYVKHSEQSDIELGDKQNEAVRVNAGMLRCFAVCEGGNLGFTPRARIEYALGGGKINLDAIDNAAGVNTSDHEVNMKILLGRIVEKGVLDEKGRTEVLARYREQIESEIIWSTYRQALAISRDEMLSRRYAEDFQEAIDVLSEHNAVFNRLGFNIPKRENSLEITRTHGEMVRPILGSLLSYAKVFIKQHIIDTPLIDEGHAQHYLFKYFPKSFVSVYEQEIRHHPLRREIIATVIADNIINNQGASFVADYKHLGQARFVNKVRAYLVCNALFGANDIRFAIFRNDYVLPVEKQYALLAKIEEVLNFATRWMVRYVDPSSLDALHFIDHREALLSMLLKFRPKQPEVLLADNDDFNRFFAVLDYLRFGVAVILTKEQSKRPFDDVATLFYLVIERFAVLRIIKKLNALELGTESAHTLRRQLMQFTEFIAVHYTNRILKFQRVGEAPNAAFEHFIENDRAAYDDIFDAIQTLERQEKLQLGDVAVVVNLLMASVI